MALPKTFAPATISRMVTVVRMASSVASFSIDQLRVRRITPVMTRLAAKPMAAASVGVKAPA